MLKITKNTKGFTVAELITVTVIMAILTAIGGRTYYAERDRFQYNDALSTVITMIKEARNAATSSREVNGSVPRDGFGVYINLRPGTGEPHFTLFASRGVGADGDTEILNQTYDKGVLTGFDDELDEVLEIYVLPPNVHFEYLEFDYGTVAGMVPQWNPGTGTADPVPTATESVVFFRPPLAESYLWPPSGPPDNHELEALGMRFNNTAAPKGSPKNCQHIVMNRVKNFPVINYSDCTEYQTKIKY